MTTEQKLMALMAICPDANVRLINLGVWEVRLPGIEIKDKALLKSGVGNRGIDVVSAIERTWLELTANLAPDQYLVTGAYSQKRRAFRWAAFMWQEVDEQVKA